MLRVGLTGGLASGKTTVAGFFRELGAAHIDADRIAHELVAPGGRAHDAVVRRFGTADRKALGAIVFADPKALADLNAIVHPLVREEIARRIAEHEREPSPARVAIVDAALLVESGIDRDLDALVVLSCPPETQVARAVARGMTESEARARIAAQAPLEAKLARATHVVETGGSLADTEARVRSVWESLS
ncbi:MAG TPA: dephospho-CoA kinase [Candidatus Polarisedimenticolaceae bacterium]|nr:dephospho-CoA kinase [Candidatus Polarisedimenticolaceae bacterium]